MMASMASIVRLRSPSSPWPRVCMKMIYVHAHARKITPIRLKRVCMCVCVYELG